MESQIAKQFVKFWENAKHFFAFLKNCEARNFSLKFNANFVLYSRKHVWEIKNIFYFLVKFVFIRDRNLYFTRS